MVTGTYLINNLYENVLFDFGVDRSYITPEFWKLLNHLSRKLREPYIVQMANGEIGSTQEELENYTIELSNHTFLFNPMSITIRIYDIIVGMDLLSFHHAEILCFEKTICLSFPNGESLTIHEDKPSKNLRIISCMKAMKYM